MTPKSLDVDVIQARLTLIAALLDDLAGVRDATAGSLEEDRMLRHAVERILAQLVDLAVSVNGHISVAINGRHPSDYRESFALAADAGAISRELAKELAPSVGLRNVLTHEYVRVDLEVIAATVQPALEGYRRYVRDVAGFLLR